MEKRLIFHFMVSAVCRLSLSEGPNIISDRPPPAVQRVLRHRLLLRRAAAQRHHDLVALALVEAFLLADADHGARVGAVAAAAERDLVHDRRAVHQPADGADVGPRQRRIVEDRGILGLARRAAAPPAPRATRRASRRRNRDRGRGRPRPAPWPAARPCAAAIGARVSQLPSGCMPMISECACCEICRTSVSPIARRHPVVGLDLVLGVHLGLEAGKLRGILGGRGCACVGDVQTLRIHRATSRAG